MIVFKITRIDIEISLLHSNDILKCHIWYNRKIKNEYANNILSQLKNENIFNIVKIVKISYFEKIPLGEVFSQFIFDNNINNINLDSYSDIELLELSRKIRKLIFKRRNNLTDEEIEKKESEMYSNGDFIITSLLEDNIKNKKKLIRQKLIETQ